MTGFYEVCGFVGTGILSVALVPQYVYCFQHKTVKNISIIWLSMYITALTLVTIYSAGLYHDGTDDLLPVLVASVVEAFVAWNMVFLVLFVRCGCLKWDSITTVVVEIDTDKETAEQNPNSIVVDII
jgi:uncharacterized protein with PQ loop repeat